MAKQRSPNYPAVGLGEAIALAKRLYQREKRAAVSPDDIVASWDYAGMSGNARTKLSALKKYGLIDESRDGLRVSDRALVLILHDPLSDEFVGAAREAAMAPELFRELYSTHSDASDDSLRRYLIIKKEFSDSGAKQVTSAFRETLETARLAGETEYQPVMSEDAELIPSITTPAGTALSRLIASRAQVVGHVTFNWLLARDVSAQLTVTGTPKKHQLERLRQLVELAIAALDDEETTEGTVDGLSGEV